MHIALAALKKYKLHSVWWMVSPQNPLKSRVNSFENRMRMTKKFVSHPKMIPCGIENEFKTQYSLQTIQKLQKHFPKTQFTWIAGMDNASIFHKWDGWRSILKQMPFVFFNRPPYGMALSQNVVRLYRGRKNVRFCLTGKTRNISSTQLRQNGFARFFKFSI